MTSSTSETAASTPSASTATHYGSWTQAELNHIGTLLTVQFNAPNFSGKFDWKSITTDLNVTFENTIHNVRSRSGETLVPKAYFSRSANSVQARARREENLVKIINMARKKFSNKPFEEVYKKTTTERAANGMTTANCGSEEREQEADDETMADEATLPSPAPTSSMADVVYDVSNEHEKGVDNDTNEETTCPTSLHPETLIKLPDGLVVTYDQIITVAATIQSKVNNAATSSVYTRKAFDPIDKSYHAGVKKMVGTEEIDESMGDPLQQALDALESDNPLGNFCRVMVPGAGGQPTPLVSVMIKKATELNAANVAKPTPTQPRKRISRGQRKALYNASQRKA